MNIKIPKKILDMTKVCFYGFLLQCICFNFLIAGESLAKEKIFEPPVTNEVELFQGITVTGTITSAEDATGLPGVNVIVKGTVQGTVTDIEGNYNIEVADASTVLTFSSVGFVTQEIVVGQ